MLAMVVRMARQSMGKVAGEPFDCMEGFYSSEGKSWSTDQRQFCCASYGRGCDTTPEPLFRCHDGGDRTGTWSEAQRAWCCVHSAMGCPTISSLPFDCNVMLDEFEVSWPVEKKSWCCTFQQLGCPRTTMAALARIG
ncbi:unnamed protein product, partial [Prorocentrum cordatum]